jgi:hypothetical protein
MANSDSLFRRSNQPVIATLANESAENDIFLFLKTLELWNAPTLPRVVLYCTDHIRDLLQRKKPYSGEIHYHSTLNSYAKLTRLQMERKPSLKKLSNLFHDFTQEKCGLLEAAFEVANAHHANGVLFCDADICWLAPLSALTIPEKATLGLSPHMIRVADEEKFGEFNAGFLWTNDGTLPQRWREACTTSRFFEQAALENLADDTLDENLYTFPVQVNYGWWRMFQADKPPEQILKDWKCMPSHILVQGKPLICIHTHWWFRDSVSKLFNGYVFSLLQGVARHDPKMKRLIGYLPDLPALL